jgi:hypothetical protein
MKAREIIFESVPKLNDGQLFRLALVGRADIGYNFEPGVVLKKLGIRPRVYRSSSREAQAAQARAVDAWDIKYGRFVLQTLCDTIRNNWQESFTTRNLGPIEPYLPWLIGVYMRGESPMEDLTSTVLDHLGDWLTLKESGKLPNGYTNLQELSLVDIEAIRGESAQILYDLRRAKEVEAAKKNAQTLTLFDDGRFLVQIPLNFGGCYLFNFQRPGPEATFCTGSSNGLEQFEYYADRGPMIQVLDRKNLDNKYGKWQIQAATKQLHDSTQKYGGDAVFAQMYPGLMKKIADSMQAKEKEIIADERYNIPYEISKLAQAFPLSFNS